MELTSAVQMASRLARKITRDPEAMSYAAEAAWRALQTYDPKRCDNKKAWVVYCVKIAVYGFSRTMSQSRYTRYSEQLEWLDEETKDTILAECVTVDPPVACDEFKLLVESFVDGIPVDVLAKRRGWTRYYTRKVIRAATARFQEAMLSY